MKVPVSLIIDDPAPIISVYYEHAGKETTEDGRPLVPTYPNKMLFEFCDIVEKRGIRGKYSVIPMPGNKGDIINGLEGVSKEALDEWLNTVKTRLCPNFTIGPEMLTHHKAVDLETGKALPMNERDFAATQNRETLTPYIEKAVSLLNHAGFDAFGVTSPWDFGIEVEKDYQAAISEAVYKATGKKNSWLFLRGLRNTPNAKPWIGHEEDGRTLVCIPATTEDHIWQTIDTPETSDAYVKAVADEIITEDGKGGEAVRVLETGGFPILIAHWQSLMSNGLGTGLRILDEVARRINERLSDRVEWKSFAEIMEMVLANKAAYPTPVLNPNDSGI
ncbi:MAG: hypothetical protein E7322_03655 [Clostridiales bacterium]|nr:hypothetical protein [Clostridiales bacterium]